MSTLDNPILKVPSLKSDSLPKPGGGKTPSPLVPVTPHLLRKLSTQIDAAILKLPSIAQENKGVAAVRVRLREDAWAKSNRPNEFLLRADLPVVGVNRIGELLVPATRNRLQHLQKLIHEERSKISLFHISTFKDFEAWTADDVLDVSGGLDSAELKSAIREKRSFRVELFPWASQQVERPISVFASKEIEVLFEQAHPTRAFGYVLASGSKALAALASNPSIRSISPTPMYDVPSDVEAQAFLPVAGAKKLALPKPDTSFPVVGVIDSGIESGLLAPWVVGTEIYELKPDTDHLHGTFVAGLIVGGRLLNNNDDRFPSDRARVFDIRALPTGSIEEGLLLERVKEAVEKNPDVKVWNCSFASTTPNHPPVFSAFAQALDAISDAHGVLFVQAAGNDPAKPFRSWPAPSGIYPRDALATPAESVRGLTVGAVCHLPGGFVPPECPAPYSRRGPGPAMLPKPEVVHYGGSLAKNGTVGGSGIRSVIPGDVIAEAIGTSFSTPLVAAVAGNAWDALAKGGTTVTPELVKGLIVHSAALRNPERAEDDRHYMGHGVPGSSVASLFCDDGSFTLLFEANLEQGVDWHKTNYPIPACLLTANKELRAEIVMTVAYAPPIDPAFADEYVQHEVEASFGTYNLDPVTNKRKHKGRVPLDLPVGKNTKEKALIEHAFKWCPTKVHRTIFRRGVYAEQWRLKLSLTRRKEIAENRNQRAYVIVTMRGLDPDMKVYSDGIRALRARGWQPVPVTTSVNVRI